LISEISLLSGINMFAVGISGFIEQTELEAIASNPKQVLMLKTFDQLRMSLSKLMKVVCRKFSPCLSPIRPLVLLTLIKR
jgi:hypothetical protein